MVKGNHSCNVETAELKKYVTFEKCIQVFSLIGGLFFLSLSSQMSLTNTCQQPNHQITDMQHILNQRVSKLPQQP